ncbi:MAG: hypothetical protein ACP5SH_24365 [Syntrophobacteraceae bacterium]
MNIKKALRVMPFSWMIRGIRLAEFRLKPDQSNFDKMKTPLLKSTKIIEERTY